VDLVGLPRRLYQVGHQGFVRQVDLVGRVVLAGRVGLVAVAKYIDLLMVRRLLGLGQHVI